MADYVHIINDDIRLANKFEASSEAAFEIRGYVITGRSHADGPLRPELRDKPQLEGYCGPMWGGLTPQGAPILRYETWAAYDRLSR